MTRLRAAQACIVLAALLWAARPLDAAIGFGALYVVGLLEEKWG